MRHQQHGTSRTAFTSAETAPMLGVALFVRVRARSSGIRAAVPFHGGSAVARDEFASVSASTDAARRPAQAVADEQQWCSEPIRDHRRPASMVPSADSKPSLLSTDAAGRRLRTRARQRRCWAEGDRRPSASSVGLRGPAAAGGTSPGAVRRSWDLGRSGLARLVHHTLIGISRCRMALPTSEDLGSPFMPALIARFSRN